MPLPTPRETLTSLLTSLFAIAPTPPPDSTDDSTVPPQPNPPLSGQRHRVKETHHNHHQHHHHRDHDDDGPATASKPCLPVQARALLTTLHVLIPPPTLLQALDLLDRRLVTRLVGRVEVEGKGDGLREAAAATTAATTTTRDETRNWTENGSGIQNDHGSTSDRGQVIYIVQSAQQQQQHHHHHHHDRPRSRARAINPHERHPDTTDEAGSLTASTTYTGASASTATTTTKARPSGTGAYLVRLDAWNCTCAAFAFAAFPAGRRMRDGWEERKRVERRRREMRERREMEGLRETDQREAEGGYEYERGDRNDSDGIMQGVQHHGEHEHGHEPYVDLDGDGDRHGDVANQWWNDAWDDMGDEPGKDYDDDDDDDEHDNTGYTNALKPMSKSQRPTSSTAPTRHRPTEPWSFGGLSLDGRCLPGIANANGNADANPTTDANAARASGASDEPIASAPAADVPCCKHLLACLLAERWSAVLGACVVERRGVSREEMAGACAEV